MLKRKLLDELRGRETYLTLQLVNVDVMLDDVIQRGEVIPEAGVTPRSDPHLKV